MARALYIIIIYLDSIYNPKQKYYKLIDYQYNKTELYTFLLSLITLLLDKLSTNFLGLMHSKY